jgi:hypothetical protein
MSQRKRKRKTNMPFDLSQSSSGGDFLPFIKIDSKLGTITFNKNKVPTVLEKPSFIFDFPSMKWGWMKQQTGAAPVCLWHSSLDAANIPRPQDKDANGNLAFKEAIYILLASTKPGGAVAELRNNSLAVVQVMKELSNQYEAEAAAHPSLLPVGSFLDKVKVGQHGNYKFIVAFTGWVAPSPELIEARETAAGSPVAANQSSAPAAPQAASVNEF